MRKARAKQELNIAKDIKNNKKGFHREGMSEVYSPSPTQLKNW